MSEKAEDKTPQQLMSEKMSQMGRVRAGKLVNPTMTEQIKEHGRKVAGEPSRKDRMASMRRSISPAIDKKTRAYRSKRDEQLRKAASVRAPQKHPRWRDK